MRGALASVVICVTLCESSTTRSAEGPNERGLSINAAANRSGQSWYYYSPGILEVFRTGSKLVTNARQEETCGVWGKASTLK